MRAGRLGQIITPASGNRLEPGVPWIADSFRRLAYADRIGCASADGTFLAYGPTVNLPRLLGWLDRLEQHLTSA